MSTNSKLPDLKGLTIDGTYRIDKMIGSGSFGEIYSGYNVSNQESVAIKVEPTGTSAQQLPIEYRVYKEMEGEEGFPKIYWYGVSYKRNLLVMENLRSSLEDLLVQYNRRLSMKTVLLLAIQQLSLIEKLHSRCIIHRDVKPDNFMIGHAGKSNTVYLIDFGLSHEYCSPITHKHIRLAKNKSLTGTARYASIRALQGCEQSRRDDLESLGYVWVYLFKGKLPWQGLPGRTNKEKYERILKVKQEIPLNELCSDMPEEFIMYLNEVRNYGFSEEPNYKKYIDLFTQRFTEMGYSEENPFEWSITIARWMSDTFTSQQWWKPPIQSQTQPQSPRREEEQPKREIPKLSAVRKGKAFDPVAQSGLPSPKLQPIRALKVRQAPKVIIPRLYESRASKKHI